MNVEDVEMLGVFLVVNVMNVEVICMFLIVNVEVLMLRV